MAKTRRTNSELNFDHTGMTSPWQLPTIAISTLGLAALLLIQKQQNRSQTDEILTAEQTFIAQQKPLSSASSSSLQKPTKSSNPLRTRKDSLLDEKQRLAQSGLGERHPLMLGIKRQLKGPLKTYLKNQQTDEISVLRKELNSSKQEYELLSNAGLNSEDPFMMGLKDRIHSQSEKLKALSNKKGALPNRKAPSKK